MHGGCNGVTEATRFSVIYQSNFDYSESLMLFWPVPRGLESERKLAIERIGQRSK